MNTEAFEASKLKCCSLLLSPPRVTLVDGACCMDKSTIPPTSLGSTWPARLLSATLSLPYPSWWQWCASPCLCTGSTLSAWKGNLQGNEAVSFSVCLCHFLCVRVNSCSCVLYPLLCDYNVNGDKIKMSENVPHNLHHPNL